MCSNYFACWCFLMSPMSSRLWNGELVFSIPFRSLIPLAAVFLLAVSCLVSVFAAVVALSNLQLWCVAFGRVWARL